MIKLPLYSIRGDSGPGITVDQVDRSDIYLEFEAERLQDVPVHRSLTADEARALAAILVHFA